MCVCWVILPEEALCAGIFSCTYAGEQHMCVFCVSVPEEALCAGSARTCTDLAAANGFINIRAGLQALVVHLDTLRSQGRVIIDYWG